jgi:hypothetical protein
MLVVAGLTAVGLPGSAGATNRSLPIRVSNGVMWLGLKPPGWRPSNKDFVHGAVRLEWTSNPNVHPVIGKPGAAYTSATGRLTGATHIIPHITWGCATVDTADPILVNSGFGYKEVKGKVLYQTCKNLLDIESFVYISYNLSLHDGSHATHAGNKNWTHATSHACIDFPVDSYYQTVNVSTYTAVDGESFSDAGQSHNVLRHCNTN